LKGRLIPALGNVSATPRAERRPRTSLTLKGRPRRYCRKTRWPQGGSRPFRASRKVSPPVRLLTPAAASGMNPSNLLHSRSRTASIASTARSAGQNQLPCRPSNADLRALAGARQMMIMTPVADTPVRTQGEIRTGLHLPILKTAEQLSLRPTTEGKVARRATGSASSDI
jgi:hypothetical protein